MLESAVLIRSGMNYFIKMRIKFSCLYIFLSCILLSPLSHPLILKRIRILHSVSCYGTEYYFFFFNQSHEGNLTFIVSFCCIWRSPTEVTSDTSWYWCLGVMLLALLYSVEPPGHQSFDIGSILLRHTGHCMCLVTQRSVVIYMYWWQRPAAHYVAYINNVRTVSFTLILIGKIYW
jgi:hypothetical protein